MGRLFAKAPLLLILFLFFKQIAFAQTITIGAIDPGPYGQGSTIAVPITIENTSGCIPINNTFNLYLSDPTGTTFSTTPIGHYDGFYATFVNGILNATVAGSNYRVKVVSTATGASATSSTFSISTGAGVVAAASSPQTIGSAGSEVVGTCQGSSGATTFYHFDNKSTPSATVTGYFINEFDHVIEAPQSFPIDYPAKQTNYTLIVKAVSGGNIGTKAYTLINNAYDSGGFSPVGQDTYCFDNSGVTAFFKTTIEDSQHGGLKYNYPGLKYEVNWGDGSPTSVYTYCDILKANGVVNHKYTQTSCGHNAGGHNNVWGADFRGVNPICGNQAPLPVSAYVKILALPKNQFSTLPPVICKGTTLTIKNLSYPGQDPNYNGAGCKENNALYFWYVDGVQIGGARTKDQDFPPYVFDIAKTYTITLRSANTGACTAQDYPKQICVQDPPDNVNFNLGPNICLTTPTVTAANSTIEHNTCSIPATYTWKQVSGPTNGVSFDHSLKNPTFTFSKIGVYKFQFEVATGDCIKTSPIKEVIVDDVPVASLSDNVPICSVNTPISFDPNASQTKTVLTGTAQPGANTFTWTLNNGATFAPGSDSHTQYPKIIFPTVGDYKVMVTHQNNCGSNSDTQIISVKNGPVVTADATPTTICEGDVANLTGSPRVGGIVTAVQWTSATGGSFSQANSPLTTYTPSAADINAGQVTLIYTVTTSLGGACSTVPKSVTVHIVKKAVVNSTNTGTVCSGNNFNYTITSPNATTYNWTAALTSGSATGFGATGSGNTINDAITNTGVTNATLTYTITPYINACPGNPFTLTVTVIPQAVGGSATADQNIVCADGNSGIVTLTGSVGNITWQRSVNGGSTWTDIVPAQTSTIYAFSGLAQTTKFRAKLNTGSCGDVFSTDATVTVNPPTPMANAGADPTPLCNLTQYTLQGNNPGTFVGVWTQESGPAATIVNPADPHSNVTGLISGNTYTFRWTIKGLPPCANTFDDVVIIVKPDVVAKFEPSTLESCGDTPINLNNTTSVQTGVVFEWDFGSLGKSNEVNPTITFPANTDGTDASYDVTLRVIDNCYPRDPVKKTIVIHPGGVPTPSIKLLPGSGGCGWLTLTVKNTSAGSYKDFDFYLLDDTGTQIDHKYRDGTDFSDVAFDPHKIDRQGLWKVYVKATNICGVTGSSIPNDFPVSSSNIKSDLQAKDGVNNVCVGGQVIFQNLSINGQTFTYKISDPSGAQAQPSIPANNTDDLPITFSKSGTFYVSIIAANSACGSVDESDTKVRIDVFENPKPKFEYSIDGDNNVKFVNKSTSGDVTPESSFTYTWDFGDGSPQQSGFTPLDHMYDYVNSPYTATLYAKTPAGCVEKYTQKIEIKFLGELFLPNAFQPASSTSELRTFMAKGQKLKEWNLQIFNNWGQLLWQTTKLDSNGSPTEGWDGTFKGQPVPQGTYIWQATAKFINGAEWKGNVLKGSLPKRTGVIHLIR